MVCLSNGILAEVGLADEAKAVLTPGPLIHWEGVLATERLVGRTAEAGNRITVYGGREGEDRLNSRGIDREKGPLGLVTG